MYHLLVLKLLLATFHIAVLVLIYLFLYQYAIVNMLSGDPIDSIGSPIKFIVHPVVNMYTVGYCCVVPAFYCSASESIVCDVILQYSKQISNFRRITFAAQCYV
jgi:hypothetical protein